MTFEFVKLRKNPKCKVCGTEPEVTGLIDYDAFCGVPGHGQEEGAVGKEWDISAVELQRRMLAGHQPVLIDVREPHEQQISRIPGANLIPLGQLAGRLSELNSADEFVVFCRTGSRSRRALELLLSTGFRNVQNLEGGINAWVKEFDPSQPVY
jgi:rhodanese-related sulfurtransferase